MALMWKFTVYYCGLLVLLILFSVFRLTVNCARHDNNISKFLVDTNAKFINSTSNTNRTENKTLVNYSLSSSSTSSELIHQNDEYQFQPLHQLENPNANSIGEHGQEEEPEYSYKYWARWRCTNSRDQFLKIFFSLIKNHNFTCPNSEVEEDGSDNEEEDGKHAELVGTNVTVKVKVKVKDKDQNVNMTKVANKTMNHRHIAIVAQPKQEHEHEHEHELRRRRRHQDDSEEGVENPDHDNGHHKPKGHVMVHYRSHNGQEQELELTKLRGCRWENETHFCHQHVLFVIEEPRCYSSSGETTTSDETDDVLDEMVDLDEKRPPSTGKVWAYGFICCTAVIIFARLGVIILPLLRKDLYEQLIITMVGLAAGTLTGSSIFHLLPKAFSLEENDEEKTYLKRCAVIAFGLWLFLMIERLLKIAFHHKERKLNASRRRKVSNVIALPSSKEEESNRVSFVSLPRIPKPGGPLDHTIPGKFPEMKFNGESPEKLSNGKEGESPKHDHYNKQPQLCAECAERNESILSDRYRLSSNELHVPSIQSIQFQEGTLSQVSTDAWMLIVGDSFLDFVDGLSIGTAFHESIITGFSISLGILLEELPHELGEFAVLLNAGLAFRQALLFKFIASCSTYLGLCVGVWLGKIEAGHYVFAMASGYILYIALADMIPELKKAAVKSTEKSVLKGLKVLFLQNVGLLIGMSLIFVMALYEDVFKQL